MPSLRQWLPLLVLLTVHCGHSPSEDDAHEQDLTGDASPPKAPSVTCSYLFLPDMSDVKTLQSEGSLSIAMDDPRKATVAKAIGAFQTTATAAPLIDDENTFVHGFEVQVQIVNGSATAFASTSADSREPFRRVSGILGVDKEQVTVNCDITFN
jgi:hypothetical protein